MGKSTPERVGNGKIYKWILPIFCFIESLSLIFPFSLNQVDTILLSTHMSVLQLLFFRTYLDELILVTLTFMACLYVCIVSFYFILHVLSSSLILFLYLKFSSYLQGYICFCMKFRILLSSVTVESLIILELKFLRFDCTTCYFQSRQYLNFFVFFRYLQQCLYFSISSFI